MTIRILCVGKLKERYFLEAEAEFLKRLKRFGTAEVVEVADEKAPETLSPMEQAKVKDREGERLLARVAEGDRVIALVIGGRRYTSEKFAERLQALRDAGTRSIAVTFSPPSSWSRLTIAVPRAMRPASGIS